MGQHYGGVKGCGYENLKIMIIEKVEHGNHDLERNILAKSTEMLYGKWRTSHV